MKNIIYYLVIAITLALTSPVSAQALKCGVCVGPNKALQYDGSRCFCADITGTPGPAGPQGLQGIAGAQGPAGPSSTPPASTCPLDKVERWSGTAWTCQADPRKLLLAE